MSAHPGPPGQLNAIDKPLLRYVFEQREQGFVVNTFSIVLCVYYLFPELSNGHTHLAAPPHQSCG